MDIIILKTFIPEIFLSASILIQLVFNSTLINTTYYNFPLLNREIFTQVFFILICVLLLLLNSSYFGFLSNNLFFNDLSGKYIKVFFIFCCLLVISSIVRSFILQKLNFFEYFTIFLLSILSLMLLISAGDMISAYLVIEMQALSFYVLAGFKRNSAFSSEAGLKYFVMGSFISGIFLFGCSIIYGALGTLNFNSLTLLLSISLTESSIYLHNFVLVGVLFVTITLLFKIAAVPFHFWAPDVYEGSPLSSTIIFSVIPKVAIITFFIRWISVLSNNFLEINNLLFFFGILTVLVGSLFAIRQKRLKRLFIYSSIAQVGFLVAALSVNSLNSIASIYFFLIIYLLTSILLWIFFSFFHAFQTKLTSFYKSSNKVLFLVNLSNMFKINNLWSLSFVIIFFSVAGIPPFCGFLSKILVLFSLLENNNLVVSLLLILISAISVFYYLRVLKVIFFESKTIDKKKDLSFLMIFPDDLFKLDCLVVSFCLFLLIFLFFYPSFLILFCHYITLGSTYF